MEPTILEHSNAHGNHPKAETVTVNNHPVVLPDNKVTGLQIKQVAIQQGVKIQEDFVLFRVRGSAPLEPIGDSQVLTVHKGEDFRAVDPDDNS